MAYCIAEYLLQNSCSFREDDVVKCCYSCCKSGCRPEQQDGSPCNGDSEILCKSLKKLFGIVAGEDIVDLKVERIGLV